MATTIACGACAAWAYLTDARHLTRSLVAVGLIAGVSSATALVFALRARRLRQALE